MIKGKKCLLFAGILWMLLCPEIYTQEGFSSLERSDGQQISKEEAEAIWQAILFDETEIELTYKSKLLEWLQEQEIF